MAEETVLTALEQLRAEARAEADAAVDEKIAARKARMLAHHIAGSGGSTTSPGKIDPATLTDGEMAAIKAGVGGKSSKVKPEDGSQDSVDVVLEYLKGNKEAAAAFKEGA